MLEIGALSGVDNLINRQRSNAGGEGRPVNAFGIGQANQSNVELSPQARILQQNEKDQLARTQSLGQDKGTESDTSSEQEVAGTAFVRVSSSVGTAARNNLTTEKATEVYQSIQDLL